MTEERRRGPKVVCSLVGERDARLPFVGARTVRLGANHMVAGNPWRFSAGDCEIRSDDEWTRAMDVRSKVLATLPAAPLIPRYGHSLWPPRG